MITDRVWSLVPLTDRVWRLVTLADGIRSLVTHMDRVWSLVTVTDKRKNSFDQLRWLRLLGCLLNACLERCSGHVPLGGEPRHARETTSLGWPGKALGFRQMNWRRWLGQSSRGVPTETAAPLNQLLLIRQKKKNHRETSVADTVPNNSWKSATCFIEKNYFQMGQNLFGRLLSTDITCLDSQNKFSPFSRADLCFHSFTLQTTPEEPSSPLPDRKMLPGLLSHGRSPHHPGRQWRLGAAGQDVGHEINFLSHLARTSCSLGAHNI